MSSKQVRSEDSPFLFVCEDCNWDGPSYTLMAGRCPVCNADVTETDDFFEEDDDEDE